MNLIIVIILMVFLLLRKWWFIDGFIDGWDISFSYDNLIFSNVIFIVVYNGVIELCDYMIYMCIKVGVVILFLLNYDM